MPGSRICPPQDGWEPIDLEGQIDRGQLHLRNRKFGPLKLRTCALGAGSYSKWSTFENCTFRHLRAFRSSLHAVLFRKCSFDRIHTDFTHTYSALFQECRVLGRITGINFGIGPLEPYVPKDRLAEYLREHRRLMGTITWSLDVREALLENAGFEGEEIARRVMFSPGQCVLYRANGLAAKIEKIRAKVLHTPLLGAFLTNVREGEQLALGNLQFENNTSRLSDVRDLARGEGIEVIESPLVTDS